MRGSSEERGAGSGVDCMGPAVISFGHNITVQLQLLALSKSNATTTAKCGPLPSLWACSKCLGYCMHGRDCSALHTNISALEHLCLLR
jgi:hypothetical protein